MKKLSIFLVSLLTLLNVQSLLGWGPVGHDVVAAIAEKHLTDKTKAELGAILDGRSIIYYSSWMDNLRNSPNWESNYKQTKTWHYANVDKGYTYQTMPKNENGDVVSALTMLTNELTNNYRNLTDSVKADYVKMIVHMVGDMHCPMHAGRLSDVGGNRTKVKWFGRQTNLHSVWDSKIVESARSWSYSEWRDHLDIVNYGTTTGYYTGTWVEEVRSGIISDDSGKPFSTDFYEKWFAETVANAAQIYDYVEALGEENPNLSYQFVYDFSTMLENSLQHGGYHLAHVLNSIFDPEGAKQVLIEFAFY